MVHRAMHSALPLAHPVVAVPLVGVDGRTRQARTVDGVVQFHAIGRVDDLQPDLARVPADHSGDRRPVGGERPVATPAVGPPPRWVGRIVVQDPFFPRVLIHLIGFDHRITERVAVQVLAEKFLESMPED
jgi:hypothetical protein